ILTVLSQNTSDVNRDRAYASLTARFGSWHEVLDVPAEEVADAIRPGGLANTKAPRIQAILRAIEEREGSVDLGFLHRMSDEEVRGYLQSLPGVGPKTAACVLAFSLERPALPVDTHVYRTAARVGAGEDERGAGARDHGEAGSGGDARDDARRADPSRPAGLQAGTAQV